MILCEWQDFSTDTETYTLDVFQEIVGDEFEAMMIDEAGKMPSFIWTVNYVVSIKENTRLYKDISFLKIPRNPVCQ